MDRITAVLVVAKRKIEINEEITLGYNWSYTDFNSLTTCLCNDIDCRKTIEKLPSHDTVDDLSNLAKSEKAGIYNCNKKIGSACYYISVMQFLFRGVSFDVVKKICSESMKQKDEIDASMARAVIEHAKKILTGIYVPYSKELHKLAQCTNDDTYAKSTTKASDASPSNQALLDCSNNVHKLIDLLFKRYFSFTIRLPMFEDSQKVIRKTWVKKKIVDKQVEVPGCTILKYDLKDMFSQFFKRKEDDLMAFYDVPNKLRSFFVVNANRDERLVHKKSLTNLFGFKVQTGEEEFNGYALLRSYVFFAALHYTTYVFDRYVNNYV